MKVTVKLVGGLVYKVGFAERELEVPPGTTAGSLLAGLGIDTPGSVITTRNGWGMAEDEEAREGDRILISPPFSGG